MIDNQAQIELRIFKRFASVCGISIIEETIEKRHPPEPDIRCEINSVGTTTFEITQIIDRDFANMVGKQYDTKNELDKYYKELPQNLKELFENLYSDAIIFIHFQKSVAWGAKKIRFGLFRI